MNREAFILYSMIDPASKSLFCKTEEERGEGIALSHTSGAIKVSVR